MQVAEPVGFESKEIHMKIARMFVALVAALLMVSTAHAGFPDVSGTYLGAGGPNPETDIVSGLTASGLQTWATGKISWSGVLSPASSFEAALTGSGTFSWIDGNNTWHPSQFQITSGGLSIQNGVNTLYWGGTGPFGGIGGVTTMVASVPEPETYAMMIAGLGLLGVAARRRKQKSAA
jgi:hypothetical protein